jgi:hypothetical protein
MQLLAESKTLGFSPGLAVITFIVFNFFFFHSFTWGDQRIMSVVDFCPEVCHDRNPLNKNLSLFLTD